MMHRRHLAAALVATLATPRLVGAQPVFPSRAVRIVVPFAPGGGTDNLVRLLQPGLGAAFGQSVVIDNRPGGGAVIGTEVVARAAPDGHTLLACDSSFLINPGLMPNLPYDTLRDFAGVTMLAEGPAVLAVNPAVPARTLAELIALGRAQPGRIGFASGGNGSLTHIAGELLNQRAGVQFLHVPYRGSAPAVSDLLAGHVAMVIAGISGMKAHIDAGALRALAVTGDRRSAALPGVPTFAEAGLTGMDASNYWVLVAPAATPIELRRRLRDAVARVMAEQPLAGRLAELGFDTIANQPEVQEAQIRRMVAEWIELVRAANIRPDP